MAEESADGMVLIYSRHVRVLLSKHGETNTRSSGGKLLKLSI